MEIKKTFLVFFQGLFGRYPCHFLNRFEETPLSDQAYYRSWKDRIGIYWRAESPHNIWGLTGISRHVNAGTLLASIFILAFLSLGTQVSAQVGREVNQDILIDTTRTDSGLIERPERTIDPDTRRVMPSLLFAHKPHIKPTTYDISLQPFFDMRDSVPGFHQTLGQIGKPYQAFQYGFESRYLQRSDWRNPVYGRYNRYVVHPGNHIPYFDTKTPYVNLNYVQGGRKLQQIDGVVSQNVSPEFNFSALYQSRKSDGVYRFHTTRHRHIAPAAYYRTKSRRYHLFVNGTFNELTDQLNGGMPRTRDLPLTQTFLKAAETPNLEGAEHKRIIRGLYAEQYYHLLGHKSPVPKKPKKPKGSVADTVENVIVVIDSLPPDSILPNPKGTNPHKLTLRLKTALDGTYQRFRDQGIGTSRIAASFVNPYPTLDLDTTDLDESYATTGYHIAGAGSYSFDRPAFHANVSAGLGYRAIRYRKLDERMTDGRTEQWAKARLDIAGINLTLHGEARFESSTLFDPETHTSAGLSFRPRLRRPIFEMTDTLTVDQTGLQNGEVVPEAMVPEALGPDSIMYKIKSLYPMALHAEVGFHNQNPSYFQRYFQASPGNTYLPNPDLKNMQLLHAHGGLAFEGSRPVLKGDTLLPNVVGLEAFYTRAGRFVYYSPEFDVRQAAEGEGLTWIGLQVRTRYRFFRKMYLEGQVTLQQGSTPATHDLERYTRHIPQVHGKASLYYDNRSLSFAGMIRIGADVHFFTSYEGQTVDALSGEFFPTSYIVQPYPRVDFYFSTQVKRAFIFVKLIHANELILNRGYYTTPFYPELERTFSFGVNWTFFD